MSGKILSEVEEEVFTDKYGRIFIPEDIASKALKLTIQRLARENIELRKIVSERDVEIDNIDNCLSKNLRTNYLLHEIATIYEILLSDKKKGKPLTEYFKKTAFEQIEKHKKELGFPYYSEQTEDKK